MVLYSGSGGKGGGKSAGEGAGASRFMQDTGSGASGGSLLYMGSARQRTGGMTPQARKNAIDTEGRYIDRWVTKEEALGDFFEWSDKKQNDFVSQGVIGGLLQLGDGPLEGVQLWSKLVDMAELYGKAGKKVSPLDLLRRYVKAAGGADGRWVREGDFEINTVTGERRYVGPQFKTTSSTDVDYTDPDTARAIATKLFQDMMGRDPRAGELGRFAQALHAAEESSPVVTTTTTEFDPVTGEAIAQDSTREGGLGAEGRALIGENQIKNTKEYGAYQAAGFYGPLLEQAVYGAPDLGV